jgi:hypothetical protein
MKHVFIPDLALPLLVGPVNCAPFSLVLIAAMASFWMSYAVTGFCLGQTATAESMPKQPSSVVSSINTLSPNPSLR